MSTEKIAALRCHCEVCGHGWITEVEPKRCAKCKGRKWNASGKVVSSVTRVRGRVKPQVEEPVPGDREPAPRSRTKVCEACGIPMKDWGRFWKCQVCRAESAKKS